MTTGDKLRLQIRFDRQELTEWANLAKRLSVTRQVLGVQAVRQLVASSRGVTAPPVPLLPPAKRTEAGAGEAIFLGLADAEKLTTLAARWDASPELVAVTAIRKMLEEARGGVVPMIRPPVETDPEAASLYVTLSVENSADNNYKKALRILEVLEGMSEKGLTPESLAELKRLEAKETVRPIRERRH